MRNAKMINYEYDLQSGRINGSVIVAGKVGQGATVAPAPGYKDEDPPCKQLLAGMGVVS
jgi:hypothetical protein